MTAADKRVQELLERWLASIERHAQYLKLDDAAYARAQDWPKHQRPSRWVVELARTRLLELQTNLVRQQAANPAFAESLELMSFLTSLLGAEHIDRFIPLATGKPADPGASGTVERPRLKITADRTATDTDKDKESSAARKGLAKRPSAPKTIAPAPARPAPKATVASKLVAAPRPAALAPARSVAALAGQVQTAVAATPGTAPLTADEQRILKMVLADAARFLEWGTEWPALAAKIAHLAGRPAEADVRNLLRAHRDALQRRTGRAID